MFQILIQRTSLAQEVLVYWSKHTGERWDSNAKAAQNGISRFWDLWSSRNSLKVHKTNAIKMQEFVTGPKHVEKTEHELRTWWILGVSNSEPKGTSLSHFDFVVLKTCATKFGHPVGHEHLKQRCQAARRSNCCKRIVAPLDHPFVCDTMGVSINGGYPKHG